MGKGKRKSWCILEYMYERGYLGKSMMRQDGSVSQPPEKLSEAFLTDRSLGLIFSSKKKSKAVLLNNVFINRETTIPIGLLSVSASVKAS